MIDRCKTVRATAWLGALFGASIAVTANEPTPEQVEFFENKIRPVLAQHCYKCHSTQSKKLKSELYLDNRERALQGGESGPSIIPGKADSSLLYRAVLYKEESLEMPPTRKLPDAVIADFKQWIDMGAPWPKSNEPQVAECDTTDASRCTECANSARDMCDAQLVQHLHLAYRIVCCGCCVCCV